LGVTCRCDGGAGWRVGGAGVGGDAGLLRPAEAAGADRASQRRAVAPSAAAARHRLHRRPRAGALLVLIRISVVVSTATAAAAAVNTATHDTQRRRRGAAALFRVRVADRCPKHFVVSRQ